jgi:hypothetical protein
MKNKIYAYPFRALNTSTVTRTELSADLFREASFLSNNILQLITFSNLNKFNLEACNRQIAAREMH